MSVVHGRSPAHRSSQPEHKLTYAQWKKEISKAFSVAGPWAPSTTGLKEVRRGDLPEKLRSRYDNYKEAGEGTITVYKKELDGRAAYFFEWPHWDQGVSFDIRDAQGHQIEPYHDKKREAEMDTNYALAAAKEDHFKGQRPKSRDKTVDHWLRMYQAVADEAGTSEYIDAPDTWKVTPKKLEKLVGEKAVSAFEKFNAAAAYRNPENGSVLLEKYENKDGNAIRSYMVLSNLGKALQKVSIKSEI